MTLDQLKKVLHAAAQLTNESEFYVIGSSAILNVFDSPVHHHLSRSVEADLIALSGDPEVADLISVMLGELSPFHENHFVYADGVTFDTPVFAPDGWQDRALRTHYEDIGVIARFMELHDLIISKLGAGRPKDLEFCTTLVATSYVGQNVLQERLSLVNCSEEQQALIGRRIARLYETLG